MGIITSPFPDVDIPASAVTPFVLRRAEELADKPAIIEGQTGRTLTYGMIADMVGRAAGGLMARGFGRGDVLAILSPNLPEYAVTFHGVARASGIVTTINPTYTVTEIHHQLVDASAQLIVTVPASVEQAMAAAEGTDVEEIFCFGDAGGATPFASLLEGEPLEEQVAVDPATDIAVLPYSSGTTGFSKGVMLTHRNLVANLAQSEVFLDAPADEVAVAVLPFFHIYGMTVLMNGALAFGTTLVTMPRFDLEDFLGVLEQYKVTTAYVVPPIVLALAKHPLVDRYDLSALRRIFSGAAPLGPELAREAADRVDAEVVQGYGLTETSPVTHSTPRGDTRPGSIGVPVPNTEVRVVDPATGSDLGVGEDGEIWIRGPQVMAGYLNNPQATARTIDDSGWLHTGDIGHFDDESHFYIVDRLKELIKYKGFQVPPAELEALLLTHPAVADAAVIPLPDEEAGEIPKAFVVLKQGTQATAEELMAHVAAHVAHYKHIRALEFRTEIPKSASGKILRRVLVDEERRKASTPQP